MSFSVSKSVLLLLALSSLFVASSAKRATPNLIWRWLFPEPEPEPAPRPEKRPKLTVQEVRPPSASKVDWFDSKYKEFHSAVLIAGSNEYRNYRHQADVCHAYRILRERGLKDENIITFLYDDIAYNGKNPLPGKLFNKPGGEDVYPGCVKDYTGRDVNRDNVLAVLNGDEAAVARVGSGRVLKKDPNQRVFLFYSDHGSVGSIGMPSGRAISARDFKKTFDTMIANEMFKELVFYLESCESGSIFQGFGYEKQNKVFPVSASEARESSFATYCPFGGEYFGEPISPNATFIGSCMGDLFSVSWMEYTEANDISVKKIADQLSYVKKRTSDDYRYYVGSHVVLYAPSLKTIMDQVVGNFLSYYNVPVGRTSKDIGRGSVSTNDPPMPSNRMKGFSSLPQRDADLMYLVHQTTRNDVNKAEAEDELAKELASREYADKAIRGIVDHLYQVGSVQTTNAETDLINELLPRSSDLQVVDDWDCFETMITVWTDMCGEMTDYSRQYTRTFANLCNLGVEIEPFAEAAMHVCGANGGDGYTRVVA